MLIRRVLMILAVMAVSVPAFAQRSIGVRGGMSADPKQFFVGAHVESPRLGLTQRVSFRPNVTVGFGDNVTTISGNVEFVVWVPFPNSKWSAYLGGGPTVNFQIYDVDSEVGGGLNVLVGFQNTSGLFVELSTGTSFAPGLRATAGYVLKRRR